MIKSAAIEFNGMIYTGKSHSEIGLQMLRDKVCPRPYPGGDHQGFVTDKDEFVDRKTALQIAIVLSSTAILAVSMGLLWASVGVGTIGFLLLTAGYLGIIF